jgi:hypothetical protein
MFSLDAGCLAGVAISYSIKCAEEIEALDGRKLGVCSWGWMRNGHFG